MLVAVRPVPRRILPGHYRVVLAGPEDHALHGVGRLSVRLQQAVEDGHPAHGVVLGVNELVEEKPQVSAVGVPVVPGEHLGPPREVELQLVMPHLLVAGAPVAGRHERCVLPARKAVVYPYGRPEGVLARMGHLGPHVLEDGRVQRESLVLLISRDPVDAVLPAVPLAVVPLHGDPDPLRLLIG